MAVVKVVILGGSAIATPELVNAIRELPDRTVTLELVLVGRDAEKLDKVAAIARMLAADDPLVQIAQTIDITAALTGAHYVINQIRAGGLEARAFDETFPRELGLPGEETVGPGGFANATRNVRASLELARRMEQICPDVTLLTFANPSSLVQFAIARYTSVRTIGLCDGPVTLTNNIVRALGLPADEVVVDYVGMHHFGWVTGVWRGGEDLLPQALEKAEGIAKDVDPAIVRAIGAIPGLYLNYVFHPDRMLAKQNGKRARAEELLGLQDEILAAYDQAIAAGKPTDALARRKANWYRAIIAPVLLALVEGSADPRHCHASQHVLNVVNGSVVPWLPPEAIIEVPTIIDGGRVRPLSTRPVPPDVQALVQANCTYEMLAVEAIVERDRAKALRALLSNPIVQTYDQAAAALDRAWAGL